MNPSRICADDNKIESDIGGGMQSPAHVFHAASAVAAAGGGGQ